MDADFNNRSKTIYLQFGIATLENVKTNKELLILIQKDDRVAFYHIYERYCKKLYWFVLKYIKQKGSYMEFLNPDRSKMTPADRQRLERTSQEALQLMVQADAQLTAVARASWRWRILYLRALIDCELVRTKGWYEGGNHPRSLQNPDGMAGRT